MAIVVVDDNLQESKRLCEYIRSYIGDGHEILCFASGEAFLAQWKPHSVELIVLDIFMEGMTGVAVAEKIRETDPDVSLVFCTTSNDFASESYDVGAKYYLHKPLTEARVRTMLDRIQLEQFARNRTCHFPDGKKLLLRKIAYTECVGRTVAAYDPDGEKTILAISQAQAEEALCCHPAFVCCSKGLVVNLEEVSALGRDTLQMRSGVTLPVSRRRYKEVQERYAEHCFQKVRNGG